MVNILEYVHFRKKKWFHRNQQSNKHKIHLTYFLGIKLSQFAIHCDKNKFANFETIIVN